MSISEVAGAKSTLVVSVIKSGVTAVHHREQTEALADAGVELRLPVDLDSGAWLQARPSNGRAKD